jgi:TolB-like protein
MRLFTELRRRNVFRVGAAYAVVAWILLQAADILLGNFGAPDWVFRSFTVLVALGFPLALFLSWAYELTPEGVKRTAEVPVVDSITGSTGRKLDFIIIGVLSIAVVWFAWDRWFGGAPDPMPATAEASIAVLPFVNMSPDPEQAYFSDGLSEEILNLLAQVDDLRVIGRTSSFAFRDRDEDLRAIGAALGVSHLLEGSVRKAGEQLRITAQLVRAEDGTNLWSQAYDRQLENVFEIQREIAESIGEALHVSLIGPDQESPVTPSKASIPAYERYLQARRLIQGRSREGLERAGELLEEAIEIDPGYAPLWASAAVVHLMLAATHATYGDTPVNVAVAQARSSLDRALELDPRLAEAHAARGLMYLISLDNESANAALTRALELNPSHSDALNWRANATTHAGQLREASRTRERLMEIDPLHVTNLGNQAILLAYLGRTDEAMEASRHIERAFPEHPHGPMRRAQVLFYTGRLAQARPLAQRAVAMQPGSGIVHNALDKVELGLGDWEAVIAREASYGQGQALVLLGREEEGIEISRQKSHHSLQDMLAVIMYLDTLALAERYETLLAEVEDRWNDVGQLSALLGYDVKAQVFMPVAVAQAALGKDEALAETLEAWGSSLAYLQEQGYAISEVAYTEAGYHALRGDREAAVAALSRAIDEGFRVPWLGQHPVFRSLRGDGEFERQVERMIDLINTERAKLGMEPLDIAA